MEMSEKNYYDVYAYFWNERRKEPNWEKARELNTYLTFRQKLCALYLLNKNTGKDKLKNIVSNKEYKYHQNRSKVYLNPSDFNQNSQSELSYLKNLCESLLSHDLNTMPSYSCQIQILFKLKKPYISKDDDNFYIIDNPIVKDKVFKVPMVRSTTWKGALRFAFKQICKDQKIEIRLFGNEKGETENFRQGRLFFYPTFFYRISLDVITPLDRKTRTPARGPIYFEVVHEGTGTFRALYYPFDLIAKGDFDSIEKEVKEDLKFLSEAIKKMFTETGFSAKKTSGFGAAEIEEAKVVVGSGLEPYKGEIKKKIADGLGIPREKLR